MTLRRDQPHFDFSETACVQNKMKRQCRGSIYESGENVPPHGKLCESEQLYTLHLNMNQHRCTTLIIHIDLLLEIKLLREVIHCSTVAAAVLFDSVDVTSNN